MKITKNSISGVPAIPAIAAHSTRMLLTFSLLLCAAAPEAWAQKVYRCGSTYSQTPCEGAVALDVDDSRTALQKRDTDQAAKRDAKIAKSMESERAKEEKQVATQDAAARKEAQARQLAEKRALAAQEKPAAHHTQKTKKGGKEPEYFVAAIKDKPLEKKPAKPLAKAR